MGKTDPTCLSIHEELIKEKSEYFRIAFDKKWNEGKTREMDMPDDEPEVISLFLEWIYDKEALKNYIKESSTDVRQRTHETLARLYVFGEKIQLDSFCNAVIVAFLSYIDRPSSNGSHYYPTRDIVTMIYEGTPAGSPARQLMVYCYVHHGTKKWLKEAGNNPDFLQDLAVGFLDGRKGAPWKSLLAQQEDFFKK